MVNTHGPLETRSLGGVGTSISCLTTYLCAFYRRQTGNGHCLLLTTSTSSFLCQILKAWSELPRANVYVTETPPYQYVKNPTDVKAASRINEEIQKSNRVFTLGPYETLKLFGLGLGIDRSRVIERIHEGFKGMYMECPQKFQDRFHELEKEQQQTYGFNLLACVCFMKRYVTNDGQITNVS